jgi:hypothetical protein
MAPCSDRNDWLFARKTGFHDELAPEVAWNLSCSTPQFKENLEKCRRRSKTGFLAGAKLDSELECVMP